MALLNSLIAEAASGATIYFETGTFELNQTIVIERDDIMLVGAEDGSTIFNFTFETENESNGIEVNCCHKQHLTEVTLDADSGADQIVVADPSGIEDGDVLYIRQPNDPEYLRENGWDNVSWENADDRPFREIIVRVASVSGDVITLADPLPYDVDAAHTDDGAPRRGAAEVTDQTRSAQQLTARARICVVSS